MTSAGVAMRVQHQRDHGKAHDRRRDAQEKRQRDGVHGVVQAGIVVRAVHWEMTLAPVESPAHRPTSMLTTLPTLPGRQRLAHKLPHHDGVHGVVELLEQKPQRHGHGKIKS